jgi:hypothetical protein
MNVYQWTAVFLALAVMILVIALPASLVSLTPDTGWPLAQHYYSTPGGVVISVASTCAPSSNYADIRQMSTTLFPIDPLVNNPRWLSNLAWAFGQLIMDDVYMPVTNASNTVDILLTPFPGTNMSVPLITPLTCSNITLCCNITNGASPLLDMSWLYVPGARTGATR